MDDVALPQTDTARRQLVQQRKWGRACPAPGATGVPDRAERLEEQAQRGPRTQPGPAGPLPEVCATSMHRLSRRRLRVLTPSLTEVVDHLPFFFPGC